MSPDVSLSLAHTLTHMYQHEGRVCILCAAARSPACAACTRAAARPAADRAA